MSYKKKVKGQHPRRKAWNHGLKVVPVFMTEMKAHALVEYAKKHCYLSKGDAINGIVGDKLRSDGLLP